MAQTLEVEPRSVRTLDNFSLYLEKLRNRLEEELVKRGIRVHYIETRFVDEDESEIRYEVEIAIELKTVERVYYEGIYEICNDAVAEKVAEGEISEDEAEDYVEECVDEEVASYDEEYGEPPFRFVYEKSYVKAELETVVEDDGYAREYIDVIRVVYRRTSARWLFERAEPGDIEVLVENEIDMMVPEIEAIVKAVRVLYG